MNDLLCHRFLNIKPYTHFIYNDNQWEETKGDDGIGKGLISKNDQAQLTITFIGTRFWLEGAVGPDYGILNITIMKIFGVLE